MSAFLYQNQINNENGLIDTIKIVDKAVAISGEILTYTSFITNNGNLDAIDFIFTDQIPVGTTFIENSVTVDGVARAGENPANGINIGNLNVNQVKFGGLPANFVSNNVQTIINDPVIPQCKCDICIFLDFCSGCFFNPCDFVRFDNSMPFPPPIDYFDDCQRSCFGDCQRENRFCKCHRCCNRKLFRRKQCCCKHRHFG